MRPCLEPSSCLVLKPVLPCPRRRHPAEYAAMGLDGAVVVSSSVALAELPRLRSTKGKASRIGCSKE